MQNILHSINLFQRIVEKNQHKTKHQEDGSVTHITEHHSEEEWESDDSDKGWVSFQIGWDTIGIDDLLEHCSELRDFEVSWSWDRVVVISTNFAS